MKYLPLFAIGRGGASLMMIMALTGVLLPKFASADYQYVENVDYGGLQARQSYEMNRGRKDYPGFQRNVDIIREQEQRAIHGTGHDEWYDPNNAMAKKHQDLYRVNESERQKKLKNELLPEGYHIFDRAHQYVEGNFKQNYIPEGWSFAISTPNRDGIDQATLTYFANGKRDGVALKFFRNEENNRDEIQMIEYHNDHQYRPTLLAPDAHKHLYAFFELPCEKKRSFLMRCVELLDKDFVAHPAEISSSAGVVDAAENAAENAAEEDEEETEESSENKGVLEKATDKVKDAYKGAKNKAKKIGKGFKKGFKKVFKRA